jgi:hypothetical protein
VAAVQHTFTHKQYTEHSGTAHIYTQTVHRTQQYSTHLHTNSTHNTENGTYITIKRKKLGSVGCARLCELYLALQLRKKHGKTLVNANVELGFCGKYEKDITVHKCNCCFSVVNWY